MAHKALYEGTVYKKKGGTELINGTVYKKAYSNNLIRGTVYKLDFLPRITINGQPMLPAFTSAYVSVPGFEIGAFITSYSMPKGTIIYCNVGADTRYVGKVVLNGETVYTKEGNTSFIGVVTGQYEYVVTCDAVIDISHEGSADDKNQVGIITITEI